MSTSKNKKQKVSNISKSEVLMKSWLGNQDIMVLAECGANRAIEIKREIQTQILADGKKILTKVVPKKRVLDYLEIDENYIFKLAKKERELNLN